MKYEVGIKRFPELRSYRQTMFWSRDWLVKRTFKCFGYRYPKHGRSPPEIHVFIGNPHQSQMKFSESAFRVILKDNKGLGGPC